MRFINKFVFALGAVVTLEISQKICVAFSPAMQRSRHFLVGESSMLLKATTGPSDNGRGDKKHNLETPTKSVPRHKGDAIGTLLSSARRHVAAVSVSLLLSFGLASSSTMALPSAAFVDATTTTTTTTSIVATTASSSMTLADTVASTTANYDGFAEYAKENKMEKSDVACFANKCGDQTKALFSNPRGIKGVVCLGRCKGEQSCATRCFAEYGSEDLNNWLSCTIEDNECVKVPKNVDNSAEQKGYSTAVKKFDPSSLLGTWYKTDGLNPNYDLFDCQTNTFALPPGGDGTELDMGIFFRVSRPEESGGGFWENALTEHMVVDAVKPGVPEFGRTMHTEGKMYGLKFTENWYILGESDGKGEIPPFKLVAYKGHTLQGNYEGAFVYAKESKLPEAAKPAVREAAAKAGLDFDKFTRIDNTCPSDSKPLNDANAGTGTSTADWFGLITGEGGVIDWVVPGWRGEYSKK